MLPKSGKQSFKSGVVIPVKLRFVDECCKKKHCNRCNSQINENKEFEVKLYLLRKHAPNQNGHMLPYSKE